MNRHETDVLIIGGGVIGLSCALALLRDGRNVTVLERAQAGHGSSHGNCGTITPSLLPLIAPGTVSKGLKWLLKPDAPLRITPRADPELLRWLLAFSRHCNAADFRHAAEHKGRLLLRSRQLLQEWVEREGIDCEFEASGHLSVYRDARAFEHSDTELRMWRDLGIEVEQLDGDQCRARESALNDAVVGGYFHPGDARLRPDRYLTELTRVVRSAGGDIREYSPVHRLRTDGDRLTAVDTAEASHRAGEVVLATGAWSPTLGKQLGLRLPIQPGKGYSITFSRPALAPRLPLVLKEPSVCVTTWGSGFRLGSTMEFSGYDESLNRRRLDALKRGAAEFLREPSGPVTEEQWYGWRPMTVDDLPIIGRPGHLRNVTVATGHGMVGMSLSAITGQLVSEVVRGAPPSADLTPLSPDRFL